jgi:hypothetical protein
LAADIDGSPLKHIVQRDYRIMKWGEARLFVGKQRIKWRWHQWHQSAVVGIVWAWQMVLTILGDDIAVG